MWSILENIPCALEKKVYSSPFEMKVLKISIRSIWSDVSFKVCVSLLILCFDDLSIGYPLQYSWASLVAQLVKNPPAIQETRVGKIPWRGERLPTPVFWPGEFRG